jgi:hypothetical protein
MSLGTKYKDPDETRMFTFDWSRHLMGNDTIDTAVVAVPTGLVKEGTETISDGNTKVSFKVSGGTANMKYTVTNTITTTGGETLERSGTILVRHQ